MKVFMMSSQIWLPFIFLILLTNISSTFVTAQPFCFDNGNYTSNSTYSHNLNFIFSYISSGMSPQGFHSASVGQNSDRVNAIAFCRADLQPDSCRRCIHNATTELVHSCPYRRQAMMYREFCKLRYSDSSIFGNMASLPVAMFYNAANVTSPQLFNNDLRALLDQLCVGIR